MKQIFVVALMIFSQLSFAQNWGENSPEEKEIILKLGKLHHQLTCRVLVTDYEVVTSNVFLPGKNLEMMFNPNMGPQVRIDGSDITLHFETETDEVDFVLTVDEKMEEIKKSTYVNKSLRLESLGETRTAFECLP